MQKKRKTPSVSTSARARAEPSGDDTAHAEAPRPSLPIVDQVGPPVERADAARNRAAILDAARRLLKRHPIEEICMDELAEAAGVGKGTIYRRFADRSSLCRALLNQEAMKLQSAVLSGFGLSHTAAFRARIDRLLSALFDFFVDNASLLSEAIAYERGQPGRFDRPGHAWIRDTLSLYITRAVQKGEIPAVSPSTTADFLLAALDPDLVRWHLAHGTTREALFTDFRVFWTRALTGSA